MRVIPVKIFEDVIGLLSNAMQEHYDAVKQTLDQVGPIWMNNLGNIASTDVALIVERDPGVLGLFNSSFSVSFLIHPNRPN